MHITNSSNPMNSHMYVDTWLKNLVSICMCRKNKPIFNLHVNEITFERHNQFLEVWFKFHGAADEFTNRTGDVWQIKVKHENKVQGKNENISRKQHNRSKSLREHHSDVAPHKCVIRRISNFFGRCRLFRGGISDFHFHFRHYDAVQKLSDLFQKCMHTVTYYKCRTQRAKEADIIKL